MSIQDGAVIGKTISIVNCIFEALNGSTDLMSCNCYLRKYFQDTNKLFDTKEYTRVNKKLFRRNISLYSPF